MVTTENSISRLRRERGLSLRAFAEQVGVSHQYVAYLEQGVKKTKYSTAQRIAANLGVEIMELEDILN